MKLISSNRDILYPNGIWRNKEGRPNKQEIIKEWKINNPTGKKIDCIRELHLSKKTVYKWWDTSKKED